MNILQLIVKIRNTIVAVKAGDWATALTLIVEILSSFAQPATDPNVRLMAAGPDDMASAKVCLAELSECIADMKSKKSAGVAGSLQQSLVESMLTALLVFFKEWFGFA